MARVLVVQNQAEEGLGRLVEWLPPAGLDVHPIHPYQGHRVPPSVEGDALIVLGGTMSAYDDDSAPWLSAVKSLLLNAVEDGVPTLGLCLGAQLLAVACGGSVDSPGAAGPELGLSSVDVTVADDLLEVGRIPVIQAHHDAVATLPANSTLLGSSDRYANQAFRVGDLAWGLQFHIEATEQLTRYWLAHDAATLASIGKTEDIALQEAMAVDAQVASVGEAIARRFAAIVTG